MLDKNDIQQIGQVVDERMEKRFKESESRIILAVGEVIEQQVLPQFDDIRAKMVDRPYLDDKLADLKGDLTVKVKRTNEKVDFVVKLLQEKGTFTQEEVRRIRQEFQIFPAL